VVDLRILRSVYAYEHGMVTAGNFASVIGSQSCNSDDQSTALEHAPCRWTRSGAFRTTVDLLS
jgi:hypothetical protein